MATLLNQLETRIKVLHSVLTDRAQQQTVASAVRKAKGDWVAARASLQDLPPATLAKLDLAHNLALWSDDNIALVTAISRQRNISSLRDMALHLNVEKLTALIDPDSIPPSTVGDTPAEKQANFALSLHNKLFNAEPSAVLQRMVQDAEIPIADVAHRSAVAGFLDNQPDFNIRTTSIYTALKHPEAFNGIADEQRSAVVEHLKTLQRVQAISPVAKAVPALMNANMTSAFRVAELPEPTFLRVLGATLGEDVARQIHVNAVNSHIRNEQSLAAMRETVRGTGLAIIDGQATRAERMVNAQRTADQKAVPLNFETLFGSMDYCECDDCLSVYSPASYFVELLQFLRNNDLGPNPENPGSQPNENPNIKSGIADTPLEKLFRRRPDLGCLELTCKNTFTVLPYIDLASEVMESFVVHTGTYSKDINVPKQATLETFNVEDETSSELLAQPQHVNYQAYCILKSAVYPFTLPYHQPIDATRIFLNYLGTSRGELQDTFRTADEYNPQSPLTPEQKLEVQSLHQDVINRAVDAEFLGLTQEEYIILTHEAFWPKSYFELTQQTTFTDADYQHKIGVVPLYTYYGYLAEAEMLSLDENSGTGQKGLTFVKKQFLPRTGLQYSELVTLLTTRFINPNFPQGQALTLLDSIRFSYRFLQTLVDESSNDKNIRFAKLIDFLDAAQTLVPEIDALLHPDPCKLQKADWHVSKMDLQNWVYCYFERIGKLIVLESGEGPRLPIEGQIVTYTETGVPQVIGTLHNDGTIVDARGTLIGNVTLDGQAVNLDGRPFSASYPNSTLSILDDQGQQIGFINMSGIYNSREQRLTWSAARDTCDLDKVRLTHLDGTHVTREEYDRMQRFIRLWRKIGWTMDETDKALTGSPSVQDAAMGEEASGSGAKPSNEPTAGYIGFDTFKDNCLVVSLNTNPSTEAVPSSAFRCPEVVEFHDTIKPHFLHQLRAIKKLVDQTGLPLPKLLSFWADISTDGDRSLYASLFLTHNIQGIDKVFQADANGNYLTLPAKLTDHMPVLMAALKLKADDISAIMGFANVADALTLANVSLLYRYSLLAKILHVRVPLLQDVIDLFGNPFKSAWDALNLLETWGKMEDAGFTFRQLDYLILERDDALRPLAPSKKTSLHLTKTLYDGLNAIDRDHQDIIEEDAATSVLVRAKAGLLFETAVVEKIIGLLEGTRVYTTNAPVDTQIKIHLALGARFKYSFQADPPISPTVSIMVIGILSDVAQQQALALSSDAGWVNAINGIVKQPLDVFNGLPVGLFSDQVTAQAVLLAADFNDSTNPQNPPLAANPTNTAPQKRLYFLQNLLLFTGDSLIVNNEEEATSDLVREKANLVFSASMVQQIIGLLEGTAVYIADKIQVNPNIRISPLLGAKLKYSIQSDANPPTASIVVTGIMTNAEQVQAKTLSIDPNWALAIDRIGKQSLNLFNDTLLGIFPVPDPAANAADNLLAGDFNDSSNPQNPAISPNPENTAPLKRLYFFKFFLPFLRAQLSKRLIVDMLSGATGMPADVTQVLLSEILRVGAPPQYAMEVLQKLKDKPIVPPIGWTGYLIPIRDDAFTFSALSDVQPADILIDGQKIAFGFQQDDPNNVWSTVPVTLKAGKLYFLEVMDRDADTLQWKTTTSPTTKIPSSVLLPDYSSQATTDVFTELTKSALLVNGFMLSADEVSFWKQQSADFDNFDFNAVTLQHWQRLQAYTDLRNNLPKAESQLLDLFKWAAQSNDATPLSEKIAAVTGWKKDNIDKLIASTHFDLLSPDAFRNEVNLVKLRQAMVVADKIAVDIDQLFEWAKPGSKFWASHQIAEDIRNATRARFDQQDWEQIVKPLHDQLRNNQKQALIAYLLVQQDVINWGVSDADGLFEFFLIDVQMDACMQTSRIKQAISSVQLFIQRCLLGLEERLVNGKEVGVPNIAIDRGRWEWMQRYRVWEANRKVFLYPENWIVPELRDDKSDFYKELESELLQKEVNTQTVQDAMKNYLFKLDEVANLKVVGLNVELIQEDDKNSGYRKLHVFARTRNAPYFFFYRWYDNSEGNWYPWQKMQVDIPSYELEDENGQAVKHGTYLIPVTWNNRLLVFFPQFVKKTKLAEVILRNTVTVEGQSPTVWEYPPAPKDLSAMPLDSNMQAETWEIKMCWTEYRNGKWIQKQVSKDAIFDYVSLEKELPFQDMSLPSVKYNWEFLLNSRVLPDITKYQFVPRIVTTGVKEISVEIQKHNFRGLFVFSGSQVTKALGFVLNNTQNDLAQTDFHYKDTSIHSFQAMDDGVPFLFSAEPYFDDQTDANIDLHQHSATTKFDHPFAHELLGTLNTGNLDDLFAYWSNNVGDISDTFGADKDATYHELKAAYSIYNWEAAFHVPMLLVDRLLNAQKFEQALSMCQYVLNPFAGGDPADAKRFWQFLPFKEIEPGNILEKLFLGLQPGQPDGKINEWRNNPFQPHLVARSRPAAYMKWVAMTYIKVLVAWGDYLFRQDTIETNNQAAQLYILASHVYGPRAQKIPKRGKTHAETYNALLDKWDAFGNAMVELELAFPFSNQTSLPLGVSNGVVGLANVFGFASTLYFCIPDNPQLTALRDTIDDRLFKLRNCENIDGVFRQLPLFEPPIDPALLVQAAAQGLSLASVLNDLNSPMPNYRFYYLLQKALEVCSELKTLGNAFLSAKEKGDGEALSRLRSTHETSIQNLLMEVKKLQVEESQSAIDALQQSRKGPVYRLQHFLKLLGEDTGKVPEENSDFGELPDQIEQPVDENGLKLIASEKEEMDKAEASADWQTVIGAHESLASIFHALPIMHAAGHPLGVGADVAWGMPNLGNATQGTARALRIASDILSFQSTSAARKTGFLRQMQDRTQQANSAGYEIKNIDRQVLTQNIRINIAQQEIINQQKQIDNAEEAQDFLINKYTNQELYGWMEDQVRGLYYQAYTLAYDLAKRAEKVFRFERGLTDSNFIQFDYWDPTHDGLLAGERLYIGLKQLEAAHQEKRGYDFEIVKNISIQQLNPLALIQLRETGRCEFSLPEVLFDMGYPGHYMRRIKSVALTIACHVGPPTSMNCVLRLLEHKFRTEALVTGNNGYVEKTDDIDERFTTVNVPVTSIAVSTGQNDSGVFELNFRDERYIPFEGAGVISKWRIELPAEFREFDYQSITEVLMQVRYTAVDGGDKLKAAAAKSVKTYVKDVAELGDQEGLFAFFDLRHDFPNEWYKSTPPPPLQSETETTRVITLDSLLERLPIFTKGAFPNKIINAADVYLFSSATLTSASLSRVPKGGGGNGDVEINSFGPRPKVGTMNVLANQGISSCPLTAWQLTVTGGEMEAEDQCWLIIRYTLK